MDEAILEGMSARRFFCPSQERKGIGRETARGGDLKLRIISLTQPCPDLTNDSGDELSSTASSSLFDEAMPGIVLVECIPHEIKLSELLCSFDGKIVRFGVSAPPETCLYFQVPSYVYADSLNHIQSRISNGTWKLSRTRRRFKVHLRNWWLA